jgi:hypothetical protein
MLAVIPSARIGRMLIAISEFLVWATLGLVLGFVGHWWKSNADMYPDILDRDRPLLNMALTEYSAENYALGHEYDDAGFWEYYSLKNLLWYLGGGVAGVVGAVYVTAEGHALARDGLCKAASFVWLTPVFCP